MRITMVALMMLVLTLPAKPERVTVTLHLDRRLYEECAIAAKSRNETLDQWMMETLEMAVSDQKVLPKTQTSGPCSPNIVGNSNDVKVDCDAREEGGRQP